MHMRVVTPADCSSSSNLKTPIMLTREQEFIVKTCQCRDDGQMGIVAMMRCLQDSAAAHADALGFGPDAMNRMNCYWVLSNLRIEISRPPGPGDRLTVTTWPSGYNRIIATREFVASDQDGDELFRAASEWMLLDKNSARPRNLNKLEPSLPPSERKALASPLSRLQPRHYDSQGDSICAPGSSIDVNGHVNNTEYVRWAIDAIDRKFKPSGTIRCLGISYLAEVFAGEMLELFISSGGDGRFHLMGKRASDQTIVYLMELICR